MTRKSQAEIEQSAKKIIDEFARSLEGLDEGDLELDSEDRGALRHEFEAPREGFKEPMLANFPKKKNGEPQMEKKGW